MDWRRHHPELQLRDGDPPVHDPLVPEAPPSRYRLAVFHPSPSRSSKAAMSSSEACSHIRSSSSRDPGICTSSRRSVSRRSSSGVKPARRARTSAAAAISRGRSNVNVMVSSHRDLTATSMVEYELAVRQDGPEEVFEGGRRTSRHLASELSGSGRLAARTGRSFAFSAGVGKRESAVR